MPRRDRSNSCSDHLICSAVSIHFSTGTDSLPVQTIGFVVGPSYPVETKALGLLALWVAAAASSIAAWQLPACRDSDGAEPHR